MEQIDKHHEFHPEFYGYIAIKSDFVDDDYLKDAVFDSSGPADEMYEVVTAFGGIPLSDGEAIKYFMNASPEKRLQMVSALLEGLQRMHDADLIHGDLHSGNILMDVKDGKFNIIDFGRVKHPDEFARDVVYDMRDWRLGSGAGNQVWPKDASLHDVISDWADFDPDAANKDAVQKLETLVQSPAIIQKLAAQVPHKKFAAFWNNPGYRSALEVERQKASAPRVDDEWISAVKNFATRALEIAKDTEQKEAGAKLPRKVNQQNSGRHSVQSALTEAYSEIAPQFDAYSIGFTLLNFAQKFVLDNLTKMATTRSKEVQTDNVIIVALVGMMRIDPFHRTLPGRMAQFLEEVRSKSYGRSGK